MGNLIQVFLDLMHQDGFVSTFQPMFDAYIRWRNGPIFCQRGNNGLVSLIVDGSGCDVNPQHFLLWCGVCMNDDALCTRARSHTNFNPLWLHQNFFLETRSHYTICCDLCCTAPPTCVLFFGYAILDFVVKRHSLCAHCWTLCCPTCAQDARRVCTPPDFAVPVG